MTETRFREVIHKFQSDMVEASARLDGLMVEVKKAQVGSATLL
jgi:hypothetical protein